MSLSNVKYSNPHPRVHVFTEQLSVSDALTSPIDSFNRQDAERDNRKPSANIVSLGGTHLVRQGARGLVGGNCLLSLLQCAAGALLSCAGAPLLPFTALPAALYEEKHNHRTAEAVWKIRLCNAVDEHLNDPHWGSTSGEIEKDRGLWLRVKNTVAGSHPRISKSVQVYFALCDWDKTIKDRAKKMK